MTFPPCNGLSVNAYYTRRETTFNVNDYYFWGARTDDCNHSLLRHGTPYIWSGTWAQAAVSQLKGPRLQSKRTTRAYRAKVQPTLASRVA